MKPDRVEVPAQPRAVLGKKTRFLRRAGWVPANVFGHHFESMAVQVNAREIEHVLAHVPRTALLSLAVDGQTETVLIQGVERKPTTGELYHVDFYRVSMTEPIRADVPLAFSGEAPAVAMHNATILHAMDHVTVHSLPQDLPTQIPVDLSRLAELDDAIHVRDLPIPGEVAILTDLDELVAKALAPTVMEEEVAAEEAAAAEAAGEAAEPTATGEDEKAPGAR